MIAGSNPGADGTSLVPSVSALLVQQELSFRSPLFPDNLFGHLVATGVPGVEEWRDGAYRRTVRLPHGPAVIALTPGATAIDCRLALTDARDTAAGIALGRFLLDLDADPVAVDGVLRVDPVLRPLIDAAPGRRVPRATDGAEFAIRAVLGQQVSTAAARTHAGRLVLAHGEPIGDLEGGLTHLFPQPAALAGLDPATLAVPGARRRALLGLIAALDQGRLEVDPQGDWARTRAQLQALPGIGPWTVETIAMRALGDPDAFIPTDLGVRVLAGKLGLPTTPGALTAHAAGWQPWRAYAVQYLWASGDHAVNTLPDSHR